ncbi:BRCA2-interacting transcriptional repressor EMSY-like [Mya arenaria]|uniref:BRCA2-interacting transcriptional repressor EMSY-like n=1 Tax=Mya arenaria TaxID=6604 RepID=UPI0022E226FF|nr:BRCA2-interacting transcriptional repressor EMSY-like [Mya arenaria]
MWPELLDMTREECKRILRRVELEAYSSVVSAFRAQGDLTKEKKKMLADLQQLLSISTERHRAEVRRAVNDEKLATIADNISPANSTQEWLIEGRRLVPLMPRLVPQTAFTVTANQAASLQAEKNAALPSPAQTGGRENITSVSGLSSPPPTPVWTSRPSSPTSNVVVLPSGMSIHIKGGLNTEEEDEVQTRKRRRSLSTENLFSPPPGSQIPQVTYTTTMASATTVSPKKITISKSPQAQPRVVASGSQTQKVILVSSQGHASPAPGLSQKIVSMAGSRSTVSTGTSTAAPPPRSTLLPVSSLPATMVSMPTPSYVTNTAVSSTGISQVSSGTIGTSTTAFLTPTISVARPRFKTIPRQKIMQVPSPRPGVVIPMSPQPVQPSPQTLTGMKPWLKPTIQIRQEGGMKIITQSAAGTTSKILPKPSQMSGTSTGTPVVVVSGASSQSSGVTMVTRTGQSLTGSSAGTKVLNIQTQGGKIITAPRGSSVVTVNPKTLHLTAVKNAAGISGSKPNVIVVQKTQPRRVGVASSQTGTPVKQTAVISSPFEKELVSFLQKQDPTKQYVVTTTTANLSRTADTQRKVIVTTTGHGDLAKQITASLQKGVKPPGEGSSGQQSNILQDLITAAGIVPEGGGDGPPGEVTINLDEAQLAALTSAAASHESSQAKVVTSMPSNEWFEYDVTDEQGNTYTHTAESADTAAAIQSLLDMQQQQQLQQGTSTVGGVTTQKVRLGGATGVGSQQGANVDISQLSDQLNQQQFYTIEQAMTLLNQNDTETGGPGADGVGPAKTEGAGQVAEDDQMFTAVPISISSEGGQAESGPLTSQAGSSSSSDLDPQTGMFYVEKGGTISGIKINADGQQVIVSGVDMESKSRYDLLSSSLAQAQIDLDPYQFIEDGNKGVGGTATPIHSATSSDSVESVGSSLASSSLSSEQVLVQKVVVSTPITTSTPAIRIQPNTFVPLQDVIRSSNAVTTVSATKQIVSSTASASSGSIHVTVEPSGMDTSYMQMEDFTSQQISDVTDVSIGHMEEIACEETVPTEGSSGVDVAGRRKRKVLSGEDVTGSPPAGSGAPGSWSRAALGVLNKVSKYRGMNRDKNDLNASSWFTQPVDPADAPDYYAIVQNPMDFGTIKNKLETGGYGGFEEFHCEMMLVKENCYLYNPEQSVVRRDCDEVFNYYVHEYNKLMEKWQKSHIGSPISKKPRTDRSPIRP